MLPQGLSNGMVDFCGQVSVCQDNFGDHVQSFILKVCSSRSY